MARVKRQTVELTAYPQLVVIYLGMRVNRLTGLKTLLGFGPRISKSAADKPDGLLLHEPVIYSLFPPHVGMRQYWRDLDSLLAWSRSEPHREWWRNFLKDSGGAAFWHESYFMGGGIEAIYDDLPHPVGMMRFAPVVEARGSMFSAAKRGRKDYAGDPVVSESELYCDQE